jgi:hypothetical protein
MNSEFIISSKISRKKYLRHSYSNFMKSENMYLVNQYMIYFKGIMTLENE